MPKWQISNNIKTVSDKFKNFNKSKTQLIKWFNFWTRIEKKVPIRGKKILFISE